MKIKDKIGFSEDDKKLMSQFQNDNIEIEDIIELSNHLSDYIRVDTKKAWNKVNKNINKPSLYIKYYIAASIIVLLFSSLLVFNYFSNTKNYESVDVAKHVVLIDGSEVILEPNSELVVNHDFNSDNRICTTQWKCIF
ncbi:MAG: hypothetical protein R2771_14045 [Saprospiraceae bacterium]